MQLYSLAGATAVDAAAGHFEPTADGGFDLPDDLAGELHVAHVDGKAAWETHAERLVRLTAEVRERAVAEALEGFG
jgi:hypothetical protein